MKIGTRITFTTVALVILTLTLYGWVSLRTRKAELNVDLERQMELVGGSARVSLEAALKDGLFEDTRKLVARWQDAEPTIRFIYFDVAHAKVGMQTPGFVATRAAPDAVQKPTPSDPFGDDGLFVYLPAPADPTSPQRLQHATIEKQAVGDHIELDGKRFYALMEPVRDQEDRVVAAIELVRDEDDLELILETSRKRMLWALVGVSVLLALTLWFSTQQTILEPAQAPRGGDRRRDPRRSRPRHPARARRRGRRLGRALQRDDRLLA